MGVWFSVMQGMVLAAILTNCFLLGFSSEQLMQWLPWLYSRDTTSGGDQMMAVGSGRLGYITTTIINHFIGQRLESIYCTKRVLSNWD